LLHQYRNYLSLLARLQIGRRLRGKVDDSDLIQDTFLEAYRHFPSFRGTTEAELVKWLHEILLHALADEVDRYVVMPGQALAYLTGKLEIIRIREQAQQRLGPAFSLPAFHAAVLDHGSLPMPVLDRSIAGWLDRAER